VETNLFGKRKRIYLDHCIDHWDEQYSVKDKRRRLRLIPCVKELLENTKYAPVENNGNWELEGRIPRKHQSLQDEFFRVILALQGLEWQVVTFFSFLPPKRGKRKSPCAL
jgi:hypothetical protein